MHSEAYEKSQAGIAQIKSAIYDVLANPETPSEGLGNSQIGKMIGIYHMSSSGKIDKHLGHVSASLLHQLKNEQIVDYNENSKKWSLKSH